MGIICGLEIICGRGSFAVLYSCSTIEPIQLNRTNRTQLDAPEIRTKKTTLLLLVRPSSMNLLVRNVNLQVRYKVSRDLAPRFMMIRQTAVFRGTSVK